MATRWLDPGGGWTLADWEDEALTVLVDFLWNTLRDAADERQATLRFTDKTNFPINNQFPDLSDLKSLVLDEGSPSISGRITTSVYAAMMETDSFEASGTATTLSSIPNELQLSDLLQNVLGYPSGTFLHQTALSGNNTAIPLQSWVKQWFQVMFYPRFYLRELARLPFSDTDFISEMQVLPRMNLVLTYNYVLPNTFVSASLVLKQPQITSPPVDLYVGGDLNEAAPFSTIRECMDYMGTKFNESKATNTWINSLNATTNDIYLNVSSQLDDDNANPNQVIININLDTRRTRFKINEEFRAIAPNRYAVPIHWYFNSTATSGTYYDFETGWGDTKVQFIELVKQPDDYYYLGMDEGNKAIFDNVPVGLTGAAFVTARSDQFSLKEGMTTVTTNDHCLYIEPNLSDESAWEFSSP